MTNCMRLMLCVLFCQPAIAAQWQHDLHLPGSVPAQPTGDLRASGSGVSLLATSGGILRFGKIATADAPLTWRPAVDAGVSGSARRAEGGWFYLTDNIGFGGIHGPCAISGRDRDGALILGRQYVSGDQDCDTGYLDDLGAVVVHGRKTVTAFTTNGALRWQSVPEQSAGWGQLARASDGALWLAGNVFNNADSRLIVLRLDSASGAELGRWEGPISPRNVLFTLRATPAGGMQMLSLAAGGGALTAHEFDAQVAVLRSTLVADLPGNIRSMQIASHPLGGMAASWTLLAAEPDNYDVVLHIARLDPQLQISWEMVIAQSEYLDHRMALSEGGRVAIAVVRRSHVPAIVLRLRSDGSIADTLALAESAYRLVYADDDHLWLAGRISTDGSDGQLLRFDADKPGVARTVDLRAYGSLPQAIAAASGASGELNVLYSSGQSDSPLRAVTIRASGIQQQPDARADLYVRK